MRLQHNMEPTPPQRTLARKRKMPGDPEPESIGLAAELALPDNSMEISAEVSRQMGDDGSEGYSEDDDDEGVDQAEPMDAGIEDMQVVVPARRPRRVGFLETPEHRDV